MSNDPNRNDALRTDLERNDTKGSPAVEEPSQRTEPNPPDKFTRGEKWFIVSIASFVGIFSPLTANIYFPAIPTLTRAFGKSTELINLTVTMYMVLQGIAPMGLVSSVTSPTEQNGLEPGFFGLFTIGPMAGPTIGPVIGGALAENLGWRSIFWFLTISAAICFIIIILFQPETLRPIVDSGRAKRIIHKPIIPLIGRNAPPRTPTVSSLKTPKNPFLLFLNVDVDILLAISALACAVFYGVLASISSLFIIAYPFLNETTIGLCFLGVGGGMIVGSSVMGRVLDAEYQRFKKREEARFEGSAGVDFTKEESFPLEKARLRLMPYFVVLMAAACAGYGWCVQRSVNIAVPIILQFIVGWVSITIMNGVQTLMIDLVPTQSSSVTACNNLIRCSLSALIVSVIDLMIKGIGIGWTYVIHCGIILLAVPLIYLSIRVGPRYRVKRQGKREEEKAQIDEKAREK